MRRKRRTPKKLNTPKDLKKEKNLKLHEILNKIYYSLGETGAYYSAEKLRRLLKENYFMNVNFKDIQKWLESQYAYTLHRKRRKTFKRNPIIATHIDHNWQMDIAFLADYSKLPGSKKVNKGNICFLLCVDVLSRFAWGEPMKSKSGEATTKALESILKRSFPRKPEKLQADKGREFYNAKFKSLLKQNKIKLYSTESDQKAAIAERTIQTIKNILYRYLTGEQSKDWVSIFQKAINTYNNTYHKSIKMKPVDVNDVTEGKVINNLYEFLWKKDNIKRKHKFKIGDTVRISLYSRPFEKGYKGLWSKQIYTITQVYDRKPFEMYEIADQKNNKVKGLFYDKELSLVRQTEESFFRVEKILRKKFIGKKLYYYVKFLDYDEKEWIPAENVASISEVKRKIK